MSDINVSDFFKDAGLILNQLYRVFPRLATLYVEDVSGPDQLDEYGLHGTRHLACFNAMLWLAEEGLIRYHDTIRQDAIEHAVLTGPCFILLTKPRLHAVDGQLEDLTDSMRLDRSAKIHGIRTALKQRSSSEIKKAMLSLLEEIQKAG